MSDEVSSMQADDDGEQHRRLRVITATAVSALSVIVIATCIALAAHSRNGIDHPAAGGSIAPAAVSSSDAPVTSEPASTNAPITSSAPAASWPPASSAPAEPSPSTSRHPTPSATIGRKDPTVALTLSPSRVTLGQQIQVTVTITNGGGGYDPPAEVSIGSEIPSDTFDKGPPGCVFEDGGANCPTVGLQPGHKTSLVFAVTPGWMPGGSGDDEIFGMLYDAGGQILAPQYSAQVWVDDGTASAAPPPTAPPSSAPPSPTTAPPSSMAPSPTAAPTSASPSPTT
jgi:hypothetical protein